MEERIRYEGQWYVLADAVRGNAHSRVLKDGDTFGLFDRYGDIFPIGTTDQGLFHQGTRYLSQYELTVNSCRPLLLNSTIKQDNTLLTVDLTTPQPASPEVAIPEGALHVFRSKLLRVGVQHEHLRITNYGMSLATLELRLTFAADYKDIFEVRGAERSKRGTDQRPACEKDRVQLGYAGLDGLIRQTLLVFWPAPDHMTESEAEFLLKLAPKEEIDLYITVTCEEDGRPQTALSYGEALKRKAEKAQEARARAAGVTSTNPQFNEWIRRSAADLNMLTTETPFGAYPYAGVPWFSTAFGRDGIITALQTLWFDPAVARGVLAFLASTQATETDPAREAEPGKILHETRMGEMADLDEIPFRLYYGTVDATPLFVILARAYYERTGDREFIAHIWPNIRLALDWIARFGDLDGDGFIEYQRHGERGLVNQGWKDSGDSIFHTDGRDAHGPIALCEVQAYAYDAQRGGERLARVLGDDEYAVHLSIAAEELRRQFEAQFWDDSIGTYVLALDGDKQPCRICSSNAGHVLFSGIAAPDRAARVAETLLSRVNYNGWGIRTIAATAPRYNPMSYHNGSVWPHDNAIAALGFGRYGLKAEALRVFTGLFNASVAIDFHRLPELFCGFDALPGQGPTLYPVACSPQAWSSGTVFMLLQAALGLEFHAERPLLRFHRPMLPEWLPHVEITNLQVGDGSVDLQLQRHAHDVSINVMRKQGDIEIAVIV